MAAGWMVMAPEVGNMKNTQAMPEKTRVGHVGSEMLARHPGRLRKEMGSR